MQSCPQGACRSSYEWETGRQPSQERCYEVQWELRESQGGLHRRGCPEPETLWINQVDESGEGIPGRSIWEIEKLMWLQMKRMREDGTEWMEEVGQVMWGFVGQGKESWVVLQEIERFPTCAHSDNFYWMNMCKALYYVLYGKQRWLS